MFDWRNLPEGVVTLVVSTFDGPRSDVLRVLRGVCKPWCADITVTKATVHAGAEATIGRVLQNMPNLQSLTVVKNTSETLYLVRYPSDQTPCSGATEICVRGM